MPIEVTTTGTGRFSGHSTNIISYSYAENSTPHLISDETGGVGDLTVTVKDSGNTGIILYRDDMTLIDPLYGSVSARIESLSSTDEVLTLTALSRIAQLNIYGSIPAQRITIKEFFRSVFTAAGITTDIAFSPMIPNTTINAPGYQGDLWVFLKKACATFELEITLIGKTIYVQPIRQREIDITQISSEGYSVSDMDLAQSINVAYYNYVKEVGALVYPYGGWTSDIPIYQVGSGETVTFDIPVSGYITNVLQPIAFDNVSKSYAGPNSVYTISGNDGLPVQAGLWNDYGGSVSVDLINNGSSIRLTITGASYPSLAPYSLSVSDGATAYSTLRIVGDGVFYDKKTVNIKTGLTSDEAAREVAAEIDNPFIDTYDQAIDLGVKARQLYAIPRHEIQLSGRSFIKRNFTEYDYFTLDDDVYGLLDSEAALGFVAQYDNVAIYKTFAEWESELPSTYLFSNFNSDYTGSTFEDFAVTVIKTFVNTQSFGSIAGSRVRYFDAFFRVRSTDITQDGISLTAQFDTLFSDFNDEFVGYDFDQWNNLWSDMTFSDWSLIPLRKEPYIDFDFLVLDDGELNVNVLGF